MPTVINMNDFRLILLSTLLFLSVISVITYSDGMTNMELEHELLVSSGYKYLVYGNQNSNGIALYDLKLRNEKQLIVPPVKEDRLVQPVIGKSGVGYCIQESFLFDYVKKQGKLIRFNLNDFQHEPVELTLKQLYANLALSPDENKLAFIYIPSSSQEPALGIFNIKNGEIEKNYRVKERYYSNPVILRWRSDNKTLVFHDTHTGLPGMEIDTSTGDSKVIPEFYLDFYEDYSLKEDQKSREVFVEGVSGHINKIHLLHATRYSLSFSREGKYLVYGWIRGKGSAVLTILDIKSQKFLEINLENHPGTVLGLALW